MNAGRASRIGKRIGSFLGAGANIATGYVLAKHGLVAAAELLGGCIVACLAVIGALNYPKMTRA